MRFLYLLHNIILNHDAYIDCIYLRSFPLCDCVSLMTDTNVESRSGKYKMLFDASTDSRIIACIPNELRNTKYYDVIITLQYTHSKAKLHCNLTLSLIFVTK